MSVDLEILRNKTILITGASGLIGTALVNTMQNKGTLLTPLHADLAAMNFSDADIIFHTAGYGQPSRFLQNPAETITVNTTITSKLFSKLKPNGSFLFCSTSEIYSGLTHPASETDIGITTPQHQRACYIEGKRCGEAIVEAQRAAGIRAVSARIALAYGPYTKKHDTRALNQFIEQAFTKGRIELLDQGTATRTYCYISDIIELLLDIAINGTQSVYNVGGISVISIAQLAQKIANKIGAPLCLPIDCQSGFGAPQEVKLDLTRIQKEFGKTDYVDLDTGLDRTIAWQKALYAA